MASFDSYLKGGGSSTATKKKTTPKQSFDDYLAEKQETDRPRNKFGIDVSDRPFNPLNPNNIIDKSEKAAGPVRNFFNVAKDTAFGIPKAGKTVVFDVAKGIVKPFVEIGVTLDNVTDQIGVIGQAIRDKKGWNEPLDPKIYPNYLNRSQNVPGYGESAPMFTGDESPKELTKKIVGNALEIAPLFLAMPEVKSLQMSLKTLGSKPITEITKRELTSFLKEYSKKVLISSGSLGGMFGAGTSIKEGAGWKQTVKNILTSVGTTAAMEFALTPIFSKLLNRAKRGETLKDLEIKMDSEILGTKVEPTPEFTPAAIEQKGLFDATQIKDQGVTDLMRNTELVQQLQTEGYSGIKGVEKGQEATALFDTQKIIEKTQKPSGVAKSIAEKGMEKKLVDDFGEVAGYTPKTVKEEAAKVADLVTNKSELARKIVTGEEQLPKDMSASMFIKGMEEKAIANGDATLLRDLAKSDIVSETSVHAQELRFLAERQQSSAVQAMKDIAAARAEKMKGKDIVKEKSKVVNEVQGEIRKMHTKETWSDFVESLKC